MIARALAAVRAALAAIIGATIIVRPRAPLARPPALLSQRGIPQPWLTRALYTGRRERARSNFAILRGSGRTA